MTTLTIKKIIKDYPEFFSEQELDRLKKVEDESADFNTQVKELHDVLFGHNCALEASQDKPLSADSGFSTPHPEGLVKLNKKRTAFGVSALNQNDISSDNSYRLFCEDVVRQSRNYSEYWQHKKNKTKQIVYVDMDNVLVNFQSGIDKITKEDFEKYGPDDLDNVPGIFALMEPNEGAIEAYEWLNEHFDTYILSTAPWDNPSAWKDKLLWVKKHLPKAAWKRLILSHHKNLLKGDYIIDDRDKRGVDKFQGKHIHFGPEGHKDYADWKAVIAYMKNLT